MKTFNMSAIMLAVGLAFSLSAMAGDMSEKEYKFLEKNSETEYSAAIVRCNSLLAKASFLECVDKARSNRNTSENELQLGYKPNTKTATSKAKKWQKSIPSDSNGVAMDKKLAEAYMDSAVTEIKPYKPNVSPLIKDINKAQQKPIVM